MPLIMPLGGCHTVRIEYVDRPVVPEVVFPAFPVLEGAVRDREARTVTVPEEWIVRVEEYHIRILETEKTYGEIKELCEEQGNKSLRE